MKTPLTAVLSSAVFLRDYKSNTKERAEMAGSIVNAGEQLQSLLDDLFHLVQNENETRPLALAEASPKKLAKEALRLEKGLDVRVDVAEAPATLSVDLTRLARAMGHLLVNAAKFSPEGSPVELKMRGSTIDAGGGRVAGMIISVLDRGPGVPKKDRERIFAPFEQGGDQLTDKPSGIGVGLHEARMIVRQHGGELRYRPRRGGGSEFTIEIPVRPLVSKVLQERAGA
jgi:signal transduction histidine kinase